MKNSLKMKEQRATLVEELQAAVDLATRRSAISQKLKKPARQRSMMR